MIATIDIIDQNKVTKSVAEDVEFMRKYLDDTLDDTDEAVISRSQNLMNFINEEAKNIRARNDPTVPHLAKQSRDRVWTMRFVKVVLQV